MPEYNVVGEAGRLDHFLVSKLPELSREKIKGLIQSGVVIVDGTPVRKPAYPLDKVDHITLNLDSSIDNEPNSIEPVEMDLDIEFEDESLLVLYKPRGLVVHPGAGTSGPTLVHGLLAYCKTLSDLGGEERAGIVHRLDRFTEGFMIVAKTNTAHELVSEQFKNRTVIKKYYAMVKGNIIDDEGCINIPIGRHRRYRHKQTARSPVPGTEKDAETKFKVMDRYNTKTLVDIMPKTGRTHQIRVHMSYIGHPVIGDTLYDDDCGKQYDGQLLQAYYLDFEHPNTKERMAFERPISKLLSK